MARRWTGRRRPAGATVEVLPLELTDDGSIRAALDWQPEAVVHLAAIASVREAREDPGAAWEVNAAGTARLAAAAAGSAAAAAIQCSWSSRPARSTASASGAAAAREATSCARPRPTPRARSAAEVAALEVWRRAGLRAVIARPFTHTGPGQAPSSPCPGSSARLRAAASGRAVVSTGNLEPVRDLLDVRDVVEAYLALLERATPGEAYNIARGEGRSLGELFRTAGRPGRVRGGAARPTRPSPAARDMPHLVGDSTKLRRATGWTPTISLDQTLQGLVDAEAH